MERRPGIIARRKAKNEERIVKALEALGAKGTQGVTSGEVVKKKKELNPRKTKLGKLVQIVAFTEPSVRLARKGIIKGGWDEHETNPTATNRRYSLVVAEESEDKKAA